MYAEPAVVDSAAREFVDLEKMVTAAEALYGPYRWGRYDLLILPPSFPFGGMENPRLTFATQTILAGDGSLVSLVARYHRRAFPQPSHEGYASLDRGIWDAGGELMQHPWFIASQFHPEFTSNPRDGHPLFTGFIRAARMRKQGKLPQAAEA